MTRIRLPLFSVALTVVLAAAPAALAAQNFEGVITINASMGDKGPPKQQIVQVKGTKWRMDSDMGGAAGKGVIINDGQGQVTMIQPDRKAYTHPPMMQGKGAMGMGDYTFTATGKKDNVLGYDCEYYVAKSADNPKVDGQWCVTSGLGFVGFSPVRQAAMGAQLRKQFPKGFFVMKGLDDKGNVRYEVVKIDKKPLDDALFAPPADYTELKMPGMPAGPSH